MSDEAHKDKIKEYLAEMTRLADDLSEDHLRRMYSIKSELNHVMCCYYQTKWQLPPLKVQSSTFRVDPKKYCDLGSKRTIVVYGDTEDSIRMTFGCPNPLGSSMDAVLCEVCLNEKE